MSAYDKYLGRSYVPGRQDCYACCREFLWDRFDIRLPNFARPTNFWEDPNLDLYAMYRSWGFAPVFDEATREGDVLLMQLGTPINSHAAVVVANNQILHHPPANLSQLDPLFPKWVRRANIVLRHPKTSLPSEKVHLHEVFDAQLFHDPEFQNALERAMEQYERDLRGNRPPGGYSGAPEPR